MLMKGTPSSCERQSMRVEVDHLPQPSHEREASFCNLEDHEVAPHEVAELPYASRPLGGKEASRLIQAFSQCKALFRLNLTAKQLEVNCSLQMHQTKPSSVSCCSLPLS